MEFFSFRFRLILNPLRVNLATTKIRKRFGEWREHNHHVGFYDFFPFISRFFTTFVEIHQGISEQNPGKKKKQVLKMKDKYSLANIPM